MESSKITRQCLLWQHIYQKMKRFREDQHGPCARMAHKLLPNVAFYILGKISFARKGKISTEEI